MQTYARPTPSPTALGEPRWFFGLLARVRASAADTDGRYTLLEVEAPPGLEAPLHVHHNEDEGFHVLEGSVSITVGDRTVALAEGDHAFGPREIPHSFVVGPRGAKMLWILTPGGFEDLVEAASVPALALTPPPPDVTPPADVAEIVLRFGNELVG